MSKMRSLALALVVCGCLPAAGASATNIVQVHARFTPNGLGVATNVSGDVTIASPTGGLPSPITRVTIIGPAGIGLNLTGVGTCDPLALETVGPRACPLNSTAGSGGGVGAVTLGQQVIEAPFTLNVFRGPDENGHVVVLLYANATTPVSVQLLFKAQVVSEPPPYGLGFSFPIPLIPTLPGASNVSVLKAHLTLGAANAAFFEKVHGKRKLVHVKGIITPKRCPAGGFPVNLETNFEDGSTIANKTTIPCPPAKRRHH
ncbi:MAG TPA: hypothetical protein VID29_04500 [Solirubrobacteraceae bacterium]|jgi:hypothetical protein